jgi:hypothetical protein
MRMMKGTITLGAVFALMLTAADASAQGESRYGTWKMQSDAPPPAINIMTYAPNGDGGMSITVESTNAEGRDSKWGYETMFDGEFHAVTGQENAETAVEVVDDYSTRIMNSRGGKVYQVILNTLSEDGKTITNEYIRMDEHGKIIRVSHATYERIG